jgi:hypothetical protein
MALLLVVLAIWAIVVIADQVFSRTYAVFRRVGRARFSAVGHMSCESMLLVVFKQTNDLP